MKKYVALLLLIAGFVQNSVYAILDYVYDYDFTTVYNQYNVSLFTMWNKKSMVYTDPNKGSYNYYTVISGILTKYKEKGFMKNLYCVYRGDESYIHKHYSLSSRMKKNNVADTWLGIIPHRKTIINANPAGEVVQKSTTNQDDNGKDTLGFLAFDKCILKDDESFNSMSTTFLPLSLGEVESLRKSIPEKYFCNDTDPNASRFTEERSCWDKKKNEWRSPLLYNEKQLHFYVITSDSLKTPEKSWKRESFAANGFEDFYAILNKNLADPYQEGEESDTAKDNDSKIRILEIPWRAYCMWIMKKNPNQCTSINKNQQEKAKDMFKFFFPQFANSE